MQSHATPSDRAGLTAGLACYLMWGLLPLLFEAVERTGATAFEIVAWRTLFSVPFAGTLVLWSKQGGALRRLGPRGLVTLSVSASLIAANWLVYVWAVTSGRVLEASLGYYLNPLLNMAAGRILFGERISPSGWAAIALAGFGVALQAAALGALPWVSLVLAISFCGYGVVRKRAAAPAQTGLFVECLILSVPAAIFAGWLLAHHGGVFARRVDASWLLSLCGPATVAPLACFAIAARRLPLTSLGFLQFISPTLQFAVGVYNGESLTSLRAMSFAFIWGGVVVFAVAALVRGLAERRAARRSSEVLA